MNMNMNMNMIVIVISNSSSPTVIFKYLTQLLFIYWSIDCHFRLPSFTSSYPHHCPMETEILAIHIRFVKTYLSQLVRIVTIIVWYLGAPLSIGNSKYPYPLYIHCYWTNKRDIYAGCIWYFQIPGIIFKLFHRIAAKTTSPIGGDQKRFLICGYYWAPKTI